MTILEISSPSPHAEPRLEKRKLLNGMKTITCAYAEHTGPILNEHPLL